MTFFIYQTIQGTARKVHNRRKDAQAKQEPHEEAAAKGQQGPGEANEGTSGSGVNEWAITRYIKLDIRYESYKMCRYLYFFLIKRHFRFIQIYLPHPVYT